MTRHTRTHLIKKLCALALEEFTDRHENRGSPCAKAYGKFDGRFSQSWQAIVCCGMFCMWILFKNILYYCCWKLSYILLYGWTISFGKVMSVGCTVQFYNGGLMYIHSFPYTKYLWQLCDLYRTQSRNAAQLIFVTVNSASQILLHPLTAFERGLGICKSHDNQRR